MTRLYPTGYNSQARLQTSACEQGRPPARRKIAAAHHRDVIDHANIIIPNSLLLMYLTTDPGRYQSPVVLASKWEYPFAS